MIGAEAKIAEGYHALKRGDAESAIAILEPIAHPRAQALLRDAMMMLRDQTAEKPTSD